MIVGSRGIVIPTSDGEWFSPFPRGSVIQRFVGGCDNRPAFIADVKQMCRVHAAEYVYRLGSVRVPECVPSLKIQAFLLDV